MFLLSAGHVTAVQRHGVRKRSPTPVAQRWYTFKGSDGDFTLDFPRAPERLPDGQGPVTIIRSYALTTPDGSHFSVNFQDIGGNPQSRDDNEFPPDHEQVVAAGVREDGMRVVQTRRLAKNVVEAEYRVTSPVTGDELDYLLRTILRRGRVYTLSCGVVVAGKEIDRSLCGRFFGSLRFLK
jgi:hypothetical protein